MIFHCVNEPHFFLSFLQHLGSFQILAIMRNPDMYIVYVHSWASVLVVSLAVESPWDQTRPSICGEAWPICEAVGPGSSPGIWSNILETYPYGEMPYSALMQGIETWSCSNLMCRTLWTPHGRHYPLGVVNEEWTGGRGTEGGVVG